MEIEMATKVILVDGGALDRKYGSSAEDVWKAVDESIVADRGRGVEAELVRLDDPAGPAGSAAMQSGAGWIEAKAAADAVAASGERPPDYMLLLGGPDLLPHCDLDNPTPDDGDPVVPSDLPYACEAPADSSISPFLAPTRVVSRLPDVPGATDPAVLLSALRTAIGAQERPRRLYDPHLAISAAVWEVSTRMTLTQLFGSPEGMQVSPPDGPNWTPEQLACRSHFANLHGSPRATRFVGQSGRSYPDAHDAAVVEGALEDGTLAAVEACYGAELFEPEGQLPMPLAYLNSGAYAFFGSTTIAYGPPDGNEWADVLCRHFMEALRRGASIGRAGLEARQGYLARSAPLDPVDQKTVAQFLVLGDPSVQPVTRIETGETDAKAGPAPEQRRERLRKTGEALREVPRWAEPRESVPGEGVLASVRELSVLAGEREASARSYGLVGGPDAQGLAAAAHGHGPGPATMHVLMQELEHADAPISQRVVVLAVEVAGRLVSVKTALTK
jgi:hypothetical protein